MCYSVPKLEGFSPRDEEHYNHRYLMHMLILTDLDPKTYWLLEMH